MSILASEPFMEDNYLNSVHRFVVIIYKHLKMFLFPSCAPSPIHYNRIKQFVRFCIFLQMNIFFCLKNHALSIHLNTHTFISELPSF